MSQILIESAAYKCKVDNVLSSCPLGRQKSRKNPLCIKTKLSAQKIELEARSHPVLLVAHSKVYTNGNWSGENPISAVCEAGMKYYSAHACVPVTLLFMINNSFR